MKLCALALGHRDRRGVGLQSGQHLLERGIILAFVEHQIIAFELGRYDHGITRGATTGTQQCGGYQRQNRERYASPEKEREIHDSMGLVKIRASPADVMPGERRNFMGSSTKNECEKSSVLHSNVTYFTGPDR